MAAKMKLSPFAILAGALALLPLATAVKKEAPREPTTFRGITVPPYMDITPSNIDEVMKSTKFLFIKHYRYGGLCFQSHTRTVLIMV